MEMDPQERESDLGDSPRSPNDEEISEGENESGKDQDEGDSCDEAPPDRDLLAEHGDVLAKLKMQVRDIKARDDLVNARNLNFPMVRGLAGSDNNFNPFPYPHPVPNFLPPVAPQPAPNSSGSSHSSEGSASSQHTWSFEEQFKQLYEINDDPRRKEFLDDLFSYMQRRGSPINRLPIMAKSVLDLYELYNLVIQRGGLVEVINKKLWQEIIKGLHLPSSITSAAFTLRTQYMKYLYPYECDKLHLSNPVELQSAIDGNRREGRRSSYGQYDAIQRSPTNPTHQMSSMSLVSQHQQMARLSSVINSGLGMHNGIQHATHAQNILPPLNGGALPPELEAHMAEYVRLLRGTNTPPRPNATSPPNAAAMEFNRMALWNLYNNNVQAPIEPQKEALNLADVAPAPPAVKRSVSDAGVSPPPKKYKDLVERPTKSSSPMSTHIKIENRGDTQNGDKSLVVSMEMNGITYQGVLFAQHTTGPSGGASNGTSSRPPMA